MKILVNLENTEDFREFQLDYDEPIENLKYIIEAELNIPYGEQDIKFEGKILSNDKLRLRDFNYKEDEILVVSRKRLGANLSQILNQISTNRSSGVANNSNSNSQSLSLGNIFDNAMKTIKQNPGNLSMFSIDARVKNECKNLKERFFTSPDDLSVLFTTDIELAETLVSQDDKRLEELVKTRLQKIEEKMKKEREDHFKLINSDPNDLEAQKKIEEMIRMKNVEENLKMAQEYLPETFLSVHMLFINLEINKHKIVGLVDTGAQTTIISEDLAKKCGVYNLIDTRYSGIAKGVGTSKILGVVHAAQLKLGQK
jgi:DNA damage-inducible protein 1